MQAAAPTATHMWNKRLVVATRGRCEKKNTLPLRTAPFLACPACLPMTPLASPAECPVPTDPQSR